MRIQFTAQELFFENDGDVAYANLMGGDGDEPEHFLIFQRGLMDDDQAIHLEYNDQSNGAYDAIASCHLEREQLTVELSRPLGGLTGVTGFDVTLALGDDQYAEFAAALTLIFQSTTLLQIN
jgi:hypothetical protein